VPAKPEWYQGIRIYSIPEAWADKTNHAYRSKKWRESTLPLTK